MSDIAITIPVWPFVTAALVAILVAVGCGAWGIRSVSPLKWVAWGVAALSGSFAAVLLAGASALTWW